MFIHESVFTKEKNKLPHFEPICEANISEVVFSEGRVKKKLGNLNPYKSPGGRQFTSENIKKTFNKFVSTVIYLIH